MNLPLQNIIAGKNGKGLAVRGLAASNQGGTPSLWALFGLLVVITMGQWVAAKVFSALPLLATLAMGQTLFLLIPTLVAFRLCQLPIPPFRTKPGWLWIPSIILLTLAIDIALEGLHLLNDLWLPPPIELQNRLRPLLNLSTTSEAIAKVVVLCLLPAIAEELFFRGFLQKILWHRYGRWPAAAASAILFALAHGNPWHIALYLLLGFYLAILYFKTESLGPVIVAHFTNNCWTLAIHALGWKLV